MKFASVLLASMLASTAAFAATVPASHDAPPPPEPILRWQFTTGLDYSSGDYGSNQTTSVLTVPFAAKAYYGDWNVRVSIPYLSIHGPANVVSFGDDGGVIGVPDPGPGERTQTSSGFGDTTVTLTRSFNRINGSPIYVDVKGRVRLPTGDEDEGLGVGAVDYGLDTEVGAAWATNGVYASLGRRFRGDSDRFDRRDGWVVSAGGWQRLNEKLDAGAFYDWSQSSITGLDAFQDIGAYLSYRLTPEFRLQGIASAGMSDTSPDYEVGLFLIYRPA